MSFEIKYVFLTITLVCLIWATYEDIKHRLIPDKISMILIFVSLPFFVYWFINDASFTMRLDALMNLLISFIMGMLFYWVGAFGGGDSKIIIALGFSTPFYFNEQSLGNVSSNVLVPPPIASIMTNYLIFVLVFSLALLITNLVSISKYGRLFSETNGSIIGKIGLLISGRRVTTEMVKTLIHDDPAEIYEEGNWKIHAPLFSESLEDEEYEVLEKKNREIAYKNAKETSRPYIWVRPQPPGLVYFLLGYIYWVLFGSPFISFFYWMVL
jgi:hypothetical protein